MADLDSIHQTISSLLVRVSNVEVALGARHTGEPTVTERVRSLIDGCAEFDRQMIAKIDSVHQRITAVESGIGARLDQLTRKLDDEIACRHLDQRDLYDLRERYDKAIAELAKGANHRDRLREDVRHVLAAQADGARAEHARPLTAERIAAASGDDLEVIAERLGLLRKGSMIDEQPLETDDSLRLRCATAFFAQSFDRDLAVAIIKECQRARYPSARNPAGWSPAEWIIDAVIAAAGAQHPTNAYVDVVFDGPPGPVASRFVELENERGESISLGHWVPPKKNAEHYPLQPNRDDDLWRLRIPLTAIAASPLREYAEQTGQVAHVHLYRHGECACGDLSPSELARRSRDQADFRAAALGDIRPATTEAQLDKFMSACADQTIQIMELRGELSRLRSDAEHSMARLARERDEALTRVTKAAGEMALLRERLQATSASVESEPPASAYEVPTSDPAPLSGL